MRLKCWFGAVKLYCQPCTALEVVLYFIVIYGPYLFLWSYMAHIYLYISVYKQIKQKLCENRYTGCLDNERCCLTYLKFKSI